MNLNKINEWYALHHMGLVETCEIKGYGPFTLANVGKKTAEIIAHDIVNVQPITGIAGTIFGLKI